MAFWKSPDVRTKNKLFGTGSGTRWKPIEVTNNPPLPDVDIRFVINWADVILDASDFSKTYTVVLLDPDDLLGEV